MNKESKKHALIWIAVLLFIYYCKKTNEKIEKFTADEAPDPNTLSESLVSSSGLRIMFDGLTTTYATGSGDRLNGINVLAPADLSATQRGTELIAPTMSIAETNLEFLDRCKLLAPTGTTHILAKIKIPDPLQGGTLTSLDVDGLLTNPLSENEGDCKYYTFTDQDLSRPTTDADSPGYFGRNVIAANALLPVLFKIVSPNPAGDMCPEDHYVSSNTCTACGAGTTRAAGDDPLGADTACTTDPPAGDMCPEDHYVSSNTCTACGAGTTRAAGDDPLGADTVCSGASPGDSSDPCAAINDPTRATCPADLCTFTPEVDVVIATCTGVATDSTKTCDLLLDTDASDACPAGCNSTLAVPAVEASCEPASISDEILTTEDINTTLQQLQAIIELLRDGEVDGNETINTIQDKINILMTQSNSDTTALSNTLTQIIADTEQLKTELSSDGGVNEELDNITTIIAALTISVQNIETIEVIPIKTCGNTSGVVGESTNFDCSVGAFNNDPSIRCGDECKKSICCTLPKGLEPSPSPTEEPSNWVTYLIIVIIIGIIIGLGYMLK